MQKYSFWLVPENEIFQEFESIIAEYAQKTGSPTFSPHMTIHGTVESTDEQVVADVIKASQSLSPFLLEIGDVECSTTYFQCVFVRIKTSAQLLDTHLRLRKALNFKEPHVFMPHASLVYGDLDMSERVRISREIFLKNKSFEARAITIVRADSGDPKDWTAVDRVVIK